jgi:hypothetical protein
MRPDKTLVLIGVLTIASVPFAIWGILAVITRLWKSNLRVTLPWLHAFRWLMWVVGMLVATPAVLGPHRYFWMFPIGLSLASISAGLAPVEGWVKRRYAPELVALKTH